MDFDEEGLESEQGFDEEGLESELDVDERVEDSRDEVEQSKHHHSKPERQYVQCVIERPLGRVIVGVHGWLVFEYNLVSWYGCCEYTSCVWKGSWRMREGVILICRGSLLQQRSIVHCASLAGHSEEVRLHIACLSKLCTKTPQTRLKLHKEYFDRINGHGENPIQTSLELFAY